MPFVGFTIDSVSRIRARLGYCSNVFEFEWESRDGINHWALYISFSAGYWIIRKVVEANFVSQGRND